MSVKHQILTTMRQGKAYSNRDLAVACGMDASNMRKVLKSLEKGGLIESTGERRNRVFQSRQMELEM